YYTKWGDGAADIEPIMDLFKTQVRQLARHLGVPREIVEKPPTPGLLPGQTAEGELGMSYDVLDLILYGLEHFMKPERIASDLGLPLEAVLAVRDRWLANEHKRRPPLTVKLAYRTAGMDFRLPYTPGRR
ncbi:MAG TPA: NAD(+) synthase, partial [Candidatus Bathyarchaeota archaeon]|nr:NAD(+) synthase [Candidatus Bathyarchaeota archaeon]HEW89711.1 NAD(+) synthase [Candidatus Bathyarchaeota archaeon]